MKVSAGLVSIKFQPRGLSCRTFHGFPSPEPLELVNVSTIFLLRITPELFEGFVSKSSTSQTKGFLALARRSIFIFQQIPDRRKRIGEDQSVAHTMTSWGADHEDAGWKRCFILVLPVYICYRVHFQLHIHYHTTYTRPVTRDRPLRAVNKTPFQDL